MIKINNTCAVSTYQINNETTSQQEVQRAKQKKSNKNKSLQLRKTHDQY